MSIFSQLWTAVIGDGAEQANDVGSLFSILSPRLFDRLISLTGSASMSPQPADAILHQTDDAPLLLSSPITSPPNLFSPASPARSRPPTTASIDLTSPTRSSRYTEERRTSADADRARPTPRKQRSADEKRLTGDYEYGTPHLQCDEEELTR
jgi:hypothetical protein